MQKRQVSEPASKRDCLLDPNQISELIMASNSDELLCDVVVVKDDEYCGEVFTGTIFTIDERVFGVFQYSGAKQSGYS